MNASKHPINSRVAIITGAGSGIGKASALALSLAGFRVVLAGRNLDKLQAVVDQIQTQHQHQHHLDLNHQLALAVETDVTDENSVAHLFQQTVQTFNRVDVLFNNAGVGALNSKLEDMPLAQWQNVMNTNVTGMFLCIREAFRVMKAQQPMGGRIINNGSISAYTPRPNAIAYTASKHAVSGLTKNASLDGRKYNIAVGQIDIGNAATELAASMATGMPQANGEIAIEPLMDVNTVAQSVVYMAQLPLSANVLFHTIMATQMPFVGRG